MDVLLWRGLPIPGASDQPPNAAHLQSFCWHATLSINVLSSGRVDRGIRVEPSDCNIDVSGVPAFAGRQEILQSHIQKQGLPLGEDVTVNSIAASTTGFTGADLANLVNEAALLAGRSDKGKAYFPGIDSRYILSIQ